MRRPPRAETAVRAVLSDNHSGLPGLGIMTRTRLGPGRLYPLLASMEARGVIHSWQVNGRRYYGLVR